VLPGTALPVTATDTDSVRAYRRRLAGTTSAVAPITATFLSATVNFAAGFLRGTDLAIPAAAVCLAVFAGLKVLRFATPVPAALPTVPRAGVAVLCQIAAGVPAFWADAAVFGTVVAGLVAVALFVAAPGAIIGNYINNLVDLRRDGFRQITGIRTSVFDFAGIGILWSHFVRHALVLQHGVGMEDFYRPISASFVTATRIGKLVLACVYGPGKVVVITDAASLRQQKQSQQMGKECGVSVAVCKNSHDVTSKPKRHLGTGTTGHG
jgi:hypothetical protein